MKIFIKSQWSNSLHRHHSHGWKYLSHSLPSGCPHAIAVTPRCIKSPEWRFKTYVCLIPSPELNSTSLWWNSRIYLSNMLPSDVDTAGLGLHVRDHTWRTNRARDLPVWSLDSLTDDLKLWLNWTCFGIAQCRAGRQSSGRGVRGHIFIQMRLTVTSTCSSGRGGY